MIRRFILTGDGREVIANGNSDNLVVRVGERQYRLRVGKTGGGWVLVELDNCTRLKVFLYRRGQGEWQIHWPGGVAEVSLQDPLVSKAAAAAQKEGVEEVRAPIPGRVVEILVPAGVTLAAGGAVLVLEAMKMQNLITTQFGGLVRDIRVRSGETVEKGQLLAMIVR
ncbi:MAG: acetyl-CoA carboxylase biotin carboxyl carrier protein subunit [Thermoanaerobaculaceae bacterium]